MDQKKDPGRELPELRDYIRIHRAALAGFLEQGAGLKLKGSTLGVVPRSVIYVRYLSDNLASISQLASTFYGRPIKAEIHDAVEQKIAPDRAGDTSGAVNPAPKTGERQVSE